jgi:predicted Rossmann fold flavoprotein
VSAAAGALSCADVAIVGAGAAGLATAIFLRRANPARTTTLFDGARRPGAKILVSGGARCNVTNRSVSERDFWGGKPSIVRRVLQAFTAVDAAAWFTRLGVALHEEEDGKLFPDSGRARDVLAALLQEAHAAGVDLLADHRVQDVLRREGRFDIVTTRGVFEAGCVVLAMGGQSLPKSGSDGAGYVLASRLGHSLVPTTPALAPLVLDRTARTAIHRQLSGVSQVVEVSMWIDSRVATRITGSLLWTHFGVSGPAALNASRHWLRARLEGRDARVTLNFCPGRTFDDEDARWVAASASRPRAFVLTVLSEQLPAAVASAMLEPLQIDPHVTLAHLTRDDRRTLARAMVEWSLPVADSRGYVFAEATAGGVPLDEINPSTMESRKCPGLYIVGEMLDVDGRIGGFNFQWAWSSGFVAGRALARQYGSS